VRKAAGIRSKRPKKALICPIYAATIPMPEAINFVDACRQKRGDQGPFHLKSASVVVGTFPLKYWQSKSLAGSSCWERDKLPNVQTLIIL
jgi:hypothetical protein